MSIVSVGTTTQLGHFPGHGVACWVIQNQLSGVCVSVEETKARFLGDFSEVQHDKTGADRVHCSHISLYCNTFYTLHPPLSKCMLSFTV